MSDLLLFPYNVLGLFAGSPSPYSGPFESIASFSLEGIQSANVALSYPRIDAFGWDGGGDQTMIERPEAELSFSFCFTSGQNERNIGLFVGSSNTTSALYNVNAERNYYMAYEENRQDLIGYSGWNKKVMALGNGVLNHYELSAAVGQPTIVNVSVGALNLLIQPSGTGQLLPSVYKQSGSYPTGVYTLPFATANIQDFSESMPKNIVLTFDSGCAVGAMMSGENSCPVQSFGFSIDLGRQLVKNLGWAYPDTRSVSWPVNIGVHASAYLNDIQVDALNRFGCPDSGLNFGVRFNNSCSVDSDMFTFQFNGAKLNTQNFSSRIGGFTQVDMSWSLKIYDINRLVPNFFISSTGSVYTTIVFPEVEYVVGSAPLTFTLGTPCYLSILSGPGILNGNSVLVSDSPDTIVVRAIAADGSDTQDITVTVV